MTTFPNNVEVHTMLTLLQNFPRKLVPLYRADYEKIRIVIGNVHKRVIKDQDNKPVVFMVDRDEAVRLLKNTYGFFNKKEVQAELLAKEEGG